MSPNVEGKDLFIFFSLIICVGCMHVSVYICIVPINNAYNFTTYKFIFADLKIRQTSESLHFFSNIIYRGVSKIYPAYLFSLSQLPLIIVELECGRNGVRCLTCGLH